MPDISMCMDKECPIKEQCYRYTATPSSYQSYFGERVLNIAKIESITENKYDTICDYYWSNKKQNEMK